MKIYIITEGGINIGFGHITRCIALYQAFEEKGITTQLIVNGDSFILDILRGKRYQVFNWLQEREKLFKIVDNADVVIIDSYLAGINFYEKLSKIVRVPVYIDDNKRLDYPEGIVVNGSIYAKGIGYPEKENITYLLGTRYIPLRREFWDISEKKIRNQARNILVTFGGMNHSGLIDETSKYIENEFDFNLCIIDPLRRKIDAKGMMNAMLETDICISSGGQTTYELARVGVPTIGICFADNQILNLEGWQKEGFVEYVGWYNEVNLVEKIAKVIGEFESYEERIKRYRVGRDCVDGKGARRISDALLKKSEITVELKK